MEKQLKNIWIGLFCLNLAGLLGSILFWNLLKILLMFIAGFIVGCSFVMMVVRSAEKEGTIEFKNTQSGGSA